LQEVLKNFGEEVETLVLPKASAQSNGTLSKIKKVFSNPLSKTVKVATSIINNKIQSIRYKTI
jgi:hypothetical protein